MSDEYRLGDPLGYQASGLFAWGVQGVGGAAPLSPDDVTITTITLSTPNRPDATERHFYFRVTFFFPFHPPPRDTPPPN